MMIMVMVMMVVMMMPSVVLDAIFAAVPARLCVLIHMHRSFLFVFVAIFLVSWSVGAWSVGRSVGWSVGRLVGGLACAQQDGGLQVPRHHSSSSDLLSSGASVGRYHCDCAVTVRS